MIWFPPCPKIAFRNTKRSPIGNCQQAGTPRKTNSRFRKRLAVARRLPSPAAMTLKIEIASDGETATFRLSGRIDEDQLVELQAEVQRYRPRLAFDLAETTLVDLAVVRFLAAHEGHGVELLRCPRYIREWIARERSQGTQAEEP